MLKDQLQDILQDLDLLGFEVSLIAGSLLILIAGLITRRLLVIQFIFVGVLLTGIFLLDLRPLRASGFGDVLVFDALGDLFKLVFGVSAVWIVFFPTVKGRSSEFYFLILSVLVGSVFMLSANHLLVIFLAVELTSFASYILTNFNFRKQSFEAGMKYLLFGGVSAAIALYGMSFIYGYTGTLLLSDMDFSVLNTAPLLTFGLFAFIGGLLFKVSLVPFHIWVPTAYEEAPAEAVAVLSTIPKIGAFVLLHRIFTTVDLMAADWLLVAVQCLGMITIVLGTLGAIRQTNARRMIAYGAIAHSGFLLIPLLIPGSLGVSAFVWYSIIYTLMNWSVFYLLSIFEVQGIREVWQFRGLGKQQVYLGALIVVIMIALTGLPPTAGFTAKFYVFSAMWTWYQEAGDPLMMAYFATAVLSVVLSLFFYLKIPYWYFLKDGENSSVFSCDISNYLLATIFTGLVLWFFFSPELLNNIAESINFIDW